MSIEIKMPQLGESVVEGTISRWLKQPGEQVEKYEALLEVMTDKVDTEVPAPEAGVVRSILVPEGETVRVGTLIAVMDSAAGNGQQPSDDQEAANDQRPTTNDAGSNLQPQVSSPQSFISPVVARLAAEHQVDLAQIPGSGAGGRVTKKDLLRYVENRPASAAGQATSDTVTATPPTESMREPLLDQALNSGPRPGAETVPVEARPASSLKPPASSLPAIPEDAELVQLSPMRRLIAEHMERSVRTAPHVTTVLEADMGAVALHRARHKAEFERQNVNLTFTAYFAQAVCTALRTVPIINASFTEQGIVQHQRIHLGIAVALDEGLIVPVLRDADEKNLLGLARAVNDLAVRARARRLKADETQGGTFTITNHGVSGSLFATPIINQPQSAILGVGAIQKRPVVVTQHGVDAIAIRPMCYLSLTFDHRLIDGATGDAFVMAVKRALEQYT